MSPPPSISHVIAADAPFLGPDVAGPSLPEAFRSVAIPASGFWRKLAAFAGPGYLVAVGYMDPGNWATDIAGGSRFGYTLLSVVLLSNFVAMFLQWLALRLGIASGRDLAQLCRERFGRKTSIFLWGTCEIAIAACDLAEVIGAAIALKLLFHLPLLAGVSITVLDTFVIMALQKSGFRHVEALVITLIGVIGACFALELMLSGPTMGGVATGFMPTAALFHDPAMLYIALGIFGATVMPHNIYLHSAIAQTRRFDLAPKGRREAIKFSTIDCFIALGFALFVNAAILILAAASFNGAGHTNVSDIQDAYKLLSPLVGSSLASVLFAVALFLSGQNSTLTGTMAGQIVMEGFLRFRMSPSMRRLLTRSVAVVPAIIVIWVAGETGIDRLLILSQVILSLQLGFAVIPLVMFTSDKRVMGQLVNSNLVKVAGFGVGASIVVINAWLVLQSL